MKVLASLALEGKSIKLVAASDSTTNIIHI